MDKQPDAKRLGAHNFVYSKDSKQMEAVADNFDFVLCTVSGSANVSRYVSLLRSNGTLCLLGLLFLNCNCNCFVLFIYFCLK